MNTTLFSIIGVLMIAIVGLGIAELRIQTHEIALAESVQNTEQGVQDAVPDVTQQPPSTTVLGNVDQAIEKVKAAYTGKWSDDRGEDASDDHGDESDEDESGDDSRTRSSLPQQTTETSPKPTSATQVTRTTGSFTMAQVAAHSSASSCYTVINGVVYDMTPFISQHQGGASRIMSLCGTDGTVAYSGQHGSARRPANELSGLKIGMLVQ